MFTHAVAIHLSPDDRRSRFSEKREDSRNKIPERASVRIPISIGRELRVLENSTMQDEVPKDYSGAGDADPENAVPKATPVVLDRQEWSRKLWHMSAGLVSLIAPLIPFLKPEVRLWSDDQMRAVIVAVTALWLASSLFFFPKFVRPGERHFGTKVVCYVLTVIGPLLAFPQHLQFGFTVLAILAAGDGAASLIGMAAQGPRLPWNSEKTFAGTIGFVLCSTPAAALVFWISSMHSPSVVSWEAAFVLSCLASLAAAIAESWRSPINDNLRVGVVAGLTLMLGRWFLIGAW